MKVLDPLTLVQFHRYMPSTALAYLYARDQPLQPCFEGGCIERGAVPRRIGIRGQETVRAQIGVAGYSRGTAVAHAGASFGAFSTSTRHMRQTPATGRPGW